MNQLQIFENKEFGKIRTVEINNEPYFVGKDVADILGYTNARKALTDHVDEDDKGVTKCDTLGGSQNMTVINESGLYSLILSSKLPTAKKFKRWVTSEVLPSIRKHGMYATDELIANPDIAIAAFQALKEEREQRQLLQFECNKQKQIIGELKPKADYTDIILQSKSLVTVTQIAKDYGMSGTAMNEMLHNYGVQYKQSGQWLLYSKYHNNGFTHSETVTITHSDGRTGTVMNTKWTQKGRLFIYNLLKSHDILPVIERDISA
jgi:prophage antirepressor-like protein